MLNPNENNHIELMDLVAEITDEVQHGVNDIIQFGAKLDNATSLCQVILKSEWERVKNGGV